MRRVIGRRHEVVGAVLFATLLAGGLPAAHAAGTRAGTTVSNAADVSYVINGVPGTTRSAPAVFKVDELLQLASAATTAVVVVPSAPARAVATFRVVNTGNGDEAIRLVLDPTPPGGDFAPVPATPALYLDTDGSGSLSAADVPYVAGSNDPRLPPDGSALVFAAVDVPAGATDGSRGRVAVTARAVTGSGATGTIFPGAGDGGVDAVVGVGGASATATAEVLVSGYAVAVVKSATVSDPAGGTRPEPGARITYEIALTVSGTGTARALVVRDPIPASTTYASGTLTLDGTPVADAAGFQPSPPRIELPVGDVAAGTTRRVRFAVTID